MSIEPPVVVAESSRPHVLLVEDNQFTRLLMVRLLESRRYRVTVANNGQEMLGVLQRMPNHSFDLALVDLAMPVMDGLTAAAEIRMAEQSHGWRYLPMIAVTALIGEENRQRVLDAGMDGFHGKPVQAEQLFSEMDRVLTEISSRLSGSQPTGHDEVDLEQVLRTVEGDWELLNEVLTLYFNDVPHHLELIQQAITESDLMTLCEVAHSLKGASGLFGQRARVYELAYALERLGRDGGEMVQARRLHQELELELVRLQKVLQTMLAGQRDRV
ncbi:MAG: response regulator [Magnetococcales bacterium]|nr:response regulator [Magnetococcales bacterium]